MNIWFASGNPHKKAELAAILKAETDAGFFRKNDIEIKIPADAGLSFDPEETGASFVENALLKARALHPLLADRGQPGPVIADDSGLCVDALDGRPGIFSARYAGPGAATPEGAKLSAAERNSLLLEELGDTPRRGARFVCAMVLLLSPDRFYLVQETFEGEIVRKEQARGQNGFGYDPVFFVPGLGRTAAELSEAEKNAISHRGKAALAVFRFLNAAD